MKRIILYLTVIFTSCTVVLTPHETNDVSGDVIPQSVYDLVYESDVFPEAEEWTLKVETVPGSERNWLKAVIRRLQGLRDCQK